jgi:PAS domain S-box-containing protein
MKTSVNTAFPHIYAHAYRKPDINWQTQSYNLANELSGFQAYFQSNSFLTHWLNFVPGTTWILNVRTGHYTFVSKNIELILGYSRIKFMEGGIQFVESLIHPEDAAKVWELVKRAEKLLLAQPYEKRGLYQFNCDFRLRRANGQYIRVLQQNTILHTDPKGNILYIIGSYTDITHWKKSDVITASLFSIEENISHVFTSAHEILQLQEVLTQREKEILCLVAKGYSSKQIAQHLCLSYYTVTKHRQNIIQKTRCKNTGDLVHFAINNGII